MTHKLIYTAAATLLMSSQPPDPRATFSYHLEPTGAVAFDLRVPPESWSRFAHGEPLDVTHRHLGTYTRKKVWLLIDKATQQENICAGGWIESDVTLDEGGVRHFRGVCIEQAVSI